jgi:hypothetical protein
MSATVTERVAAGAAFLDQTEPGWDARIDLDRLDIGSDCGCVLGQLHGSYSSALGYVFDPAELDPDISRGFVWSAVKLPLPETEAEAKRQDAAAEAEINELNTEWKRLVDARRQSAYERLIAAQDQPGVIQAALKLAGHLPVLSGAAS